MADVGRERVTALWREASVAVAHADADYVLRWLEQSEAPSNIIALQERATAVLAECGRLREQLDAARQALEAVVITGGAGGGT